MYHHLVRSVKACWLMFRRYQTALFGAGLFSSGPELLMSGCLDPAANVIVYRDCRRRRIVGREVNYLSQLRYTGVSRPTVRTVDNIFIVFLTVNATEWRPNSSHFAAIVVRTLIRILVLFTMKRDIRNEI